MNIVEVAVEVEELQQTFDVWTTITPTHQLFSYGTLERAKNDLGANSPAIAIIHTTFKPPAPEWRLEMASDGWLVLRGKRSRHEIARADGNREMILKNALPTPPPLGLVIESRQSSYECRFTIESIRSAVTAAGLDWPKRPEIK